MLWLTALTAIAPLTWGTTYFLTTEFLPADRPLLSGALRALPAGLLAVALSRTLPTGRWWWRAAVPGVLNIGAFFALLFIGGPLPPRRCCRHPRFDRAPGRGRVGLRVAR